MQNNVTWPLKLQDLQASNTLEFTKKYYNEKSVAAVAVGITST